MKPFLVLLLITVLYACNNNTDTNDPLANTTWKIKYSGLLNSPHANGFIPESALIDAMFTSTPDEEKNIGTWLFRTSSHHHKNKFYEFNGTDPATSIGTYSFKYKWGNECIEVVEDYNFNKLTIDNEYLLTKMALDINSPNLLFVYKRYSSSTITDPNNIESEAWFFYVYELTDETPPSCSTSNDNPLPNADHLVGTWNTEITFENKIQTKGKIIIESISFDTTTKGKNYTINGKFQEEIKGKITEYPFVSTLSSLTDFHPIENYMIIEASNGIDTFKFNGKFNIDGKYIGMYLDESVYINGEPLGDFTATKN